MFLFTVLNGLVLKAQAIHMCSSTCTGRIFTTWGPAVQQEEQDAHVALQSATYCAKAAGGKKDLRSGPEL